MERARRGLTRRAFLTATAAGALASALPGCRLPRDPGAAPGAPPFAHGVASGDPLADRVVLWTRVTPPPGSSGLLDVAWRVARDPELRDVVARGSVATSAARDHTVKVDARGLEPGGTWFYAFDALGVASPVGRTRTLPERGAERLRLAFASCANYPQGFYNAYRHIAERDDLDLVLHLGDYIYEHGDGAYDDGPGLGRTLDPPHEIVTLADYRRRYAHYRRDPDLQALHAAHPMIAVWDDHEIADDAWVGGAQNHDPASEGAWSVRKAAAIRAYHEWLPVRALPGDAVADRRGRTWRSFRFGDLADLVMLDTRLAGRDRQAQRDDVAAMRAPDRSLLGPAQEAWLLDQLERSASEGIPWRIIGQQVPFGPLAAPPRAPLTDKWEGYAASRGRVLDHLEAHGIDDVVLLAGDVHSSWALDVVRDPFAPGGYDPRSGYGARAVELVTPAISSSPLGWIDALAEPFRELERTHPHVRFADLEQRGYGILDVDRERARGEWWFVDTVERRAPGARRAAALETRRGANHLRRA